MMTVTTLNPNESHITEFSRGFISEKCARPNYRITEAVGLAKNPIESSVPIARFIVGRSTCSRLAQLRKGAPNEFTLHQPISATRTSAVRVRYDVGEQPGEGTYYCVDCDWAIQLETPDEVLPPCGNCSAGDITEYEAR